MYHALALVSLFAVFGSVTASSQTGCIVGDCYNGSGTFRVEDGTTYEGDFSNGTWHGQGTLTAADGMSWSGGWMNGVMHGNGVLTLPNGLVARGLWQNDKREGLHVLTFPGVPSEYAIFEADEVVRMLTAEEAAAIDPSINDGSDSSADELGLGLGGLYQPQNANDIQQGFGFTYAAHPDDEAVTVIVAVGPGSTANQAGIRSGDHLVAVNGTEIYGLDVQTIADLLASAKEAPEATLDIFRMATGAGNGQSASISVEVGAFSVDALRLADEEMRPRVLGVN